MGYPALEKLDESIDKILNIKAPSEVSMIENSIDRIKKLLKDNHLLFLGNGRCTFEIHKGDTISCDVRFTGSGVSGTILLADQIKRFLNKDGLLHKDEVHEVFDFLREAEIKLEYFE